MQGRKATLIAERFDRVAGFPSYRLKLLSSCPNAAVRHAAAGEGRDLWDGGQGASFLSTQNSCYRLPTPGRKLSRFCHIAVRNRIGPPLRLGVLRENLKPFAHRDAFIDGLKKAGVPE